MAVELESAKRIGAIIKKMNSITKENDTTLDAAARSVVVRYQTHYEDGYFAGKAEGEESASATTIALVDRSIEEIVCNAPSIGEQTFYRCVSLKKADFPLVSRIESAAFRYCGALEALILRAGTVVTLQATSIFTASGISAGTACIYVPGELVELYKIATNWSTYASQFRALEDYTVDGTTTGRLDSTKTGGSI